MLRAVILGAPASGKGTISSRISKHFDVVHISSGDLLRDEIRKNSGIGITANHLISQGMLVPDELIDKLISSRLDTFSSKSWLLDGYPRTIAQAEYLLSKHKLQLAIALEVPVEELIYRLKGRWIHPGSGRIYNETFNQPKVAGKDDFTGELLIQRPDDAPEAIRRRMEIYNKTVQPLLNFYESHKILHRFSGRKSDEIWPHVLKCVKNVIDTASIK